MLTTKQMLNVVNAFITINILEVSTNLSYIERLAKAVKLLDSNEIAFKQFTQMFSNKHVCKIMIDWIDARY